MDIDDLDEEQLLLLLLIYRRRKEKKVKKYRKRFWVRRIFQERKTKGEYHSLVKELILFDHERFFKMFRMLPQQFEALLSWVGPKILKADTRKDVISVDERLCVTLRYLATGDAYSTLASSYRIGDTTVARIIQETTVAIWDALTEQGYLKIPENKEEWKKIADDFEKRWNFPNCLGSIDGKHIVIQAPRGSGSLFYNYKKSFSIVLMAVCNANYKFTMVDIGEAGRQSDGGVFANSDIGYCISNNHLPLPAARQLDNTATLFPYVFLGDDAFPLRTNLIKPYAETNLDIRKLIANYRISRARRMIENSFGILAARFRVFRRPIYAKVSTVESITKATVALHNFLMANRTSGEGRYCPAGFADYEISGQARKGNWRELVHNDSGLLPVRQLGSNNYSKRAKEVRDNFCNYFCSPEGEVPWQWDIYSVDVGH